MAGVWTMSSDDSILDLQGPPAARHVRWRSSMIARTALGLTLIVAMLLHLSYACLVETVDGLERDMAHVQTARDGIAVR